MKFIKKFMLGTKGKMTQVFDEKGVVTPATIITAGPLTITQVKTTEKDGYAGVQVGFGVRKENRTNKPLKGHLKDLEGSFQHLREFPGEGSRGDKIEVSTFAPGDTVTVSAISKGKGFQGVVKRHGFHGVGEQSHGQHDRSRAPGSIGGSSYPSRVFKGMRMAGRMGNDRVKLKGLKIVKIFAEKNYILVILNIYIMIML